MHDPEMADGGMFFDAYADSFTQYFRMQDYLLNGCYCDLMEGYELRNIISRRMWLSNADNMLLLFFGQRLFPDHGDNPMQDFPCRLPNYEDIRTHDGSRRAEIELHKYGGKLSRSTLNEFKLYLNSVEQNVQAESNKLMLAKIYKALRLTTAVRDLEESLPEIALEMIFLLLHTTFQVKSRKPITPPEKPHTDLCQKFLEGSAARRFIEFAGLINESYREWVKFNLDPVVCKFRHLPRRLFHMVLAFHAIARNCQKMILNEYCRTTAVILVLMNFLEKEKWRNPCYEATKQSVTKIIMILRESFQYMQGPSLLPGMDKKHLSEVRKRFVSKMQKKFQAAHDDLYDQKSKMITKTALFRGLKRCSFEKNTAFKFLCPFKELINCYTEYPKALEEYMVEDRYRFDMKLTYNNIFFSEEDCLLNLPLMSEEAMKDFLTSPITRMCDLPIDSRFIRNFNRYDEESTKSKILRQRDTKNSAFLASDGPKQERGCSKSNASADNSETEKEIEIEVENHGNSEELSNGASSTDNHANSSDENSKNSEETSGDESRTSSEEEERDLPNKIENCIIRNFNRNRYDEGSTKCKILRQRDAMISEFLASDGPRQEMGRSKLNSSADNSETEEEIEVESHGNVDELSNDVSLTPSHANPSDSLTTGRQISGTVHGIQTDIENNCLVNKALRDLDIVIDDSDVDSNSDGFENCSSDNDSFVILPEVCDIEFSSDVCRYHFE